MTIFSLIQYVIFSLAIIHVKSVEGARHWTVFRVWEAYVNLTHVQHLVLLHGIIEVTKLKIISHAENDLISFEGRFILLFYNFYMLICKVNSVFNVYYDKHRTGQSTLTYISGSYNARFV